MGFAVEERHWWNVKIHQLVIVQTEPKNMLIHHIIYHCELFSWFIFFADSEILNFFGCLQAYAHCVDDHLPTVSRMA